jgi:hypothetical protein
MINDKPPTKQERFRAICFYALFIENFTDFILKIVNRLIDIRVFIGVVVMASETR